MVQPKAAERAGVVLLSFLAGAATVIQSRINGAVGLAARDGVIAASLSFSVSLLATAVIVLSLRRLRTAVALALGAVSWSRTSGRRAASALRPWHLLGGAGGATFVVGQGAAVPALGVAVFTVAVVAAQNANSLVADHFGLGPAGRKLVTRPRVVAALVATAGVGIAVSGQLDSPAFGVAALVLALAAGAAVALQQAVNARVAVAGGSSWAAAIINFVVGWICVNAVLLVIEIAGGRGWPWAGDWFQPWMILGGLIGVLFILVAAVAVQYLGVLLFALSSIAGQVAGALVVGVVAPTPGSYVDAAMVVGVLVTGGAVLLAAYWAGDGNQARRQGNGTGDQDGAG